MASVEVNLSYEEIFPADTLLKLLGTDDVPLAMSPRNGLVPIAHSKLNGVPTSSHTPIETLVRL
jgi:hypothetical protein